MTHPSIKHLGDSAFLIRGVQGTLAIDIGEFVDVAAIDIGVDVAVSTHSHSDHFDAVKLSGLGCPVWGPADLPQDHITTQDLPPEIRTQIIDDVLVTALEVDHGAVSAPILHFGMLIEMDGTTIWHAGDLAIDDLPHPPPADLVLVPIGGTWVLDADGAADYLEKLGHEGLVCPMHFDYDASQVQRFAKLSAERPWQLIDARDWAPVRPTAGA